MQLDSLELLRAVIKWNQEHPEKMSLRENEFHDRRSFISTVSDVGVEEFINKFPIHSSYHCSIEDRTEIVEYAHVDVKIVFQFHESVEVGMPPERIIARILNSFEFKKMAN